MTDERLARKERRQARRRARILTAARALLEAGGAPALSMAALAEAADTAPSTLYYYFASKEAVADAVAVELVAEEGAVLHGALAGAEGGLASVVATMRARGRHYLDHPGSFGILYVAMPGLGVGAEALQRHIYPLSAEIMGALEARLAADQAAGRIAAELSPRLFANVAFLTVQGILATTLGMRAAGGALRFGAEALIDEAIAGIERAARPG